MNSARIVLSLCLITTHRSFPPYLPSCLNCVYPLIPKILLLFASGTQSDFGSAKTRCCVLYHTRRRTNCQVVTNTTYHLKEKTRAYAETATLVAISIVKSTRCTNVMKFIYFGMTLYMFQTVYTYSNRHMADAIFSLNCWWWTERPSETCRVSLGSCDRASWANHEERKTKKMQQLDVYY